MKGQQEPKIKSLLSREKAEDEVIRHFEKTDGSRKIIAWKQINTESTGVDDEHTKTDANGIRRAVEARIKDPGRKPQESDFHRRGKGGERSARMARSANG